MKWLFARTGLCLLFAASVSAGGGPSQDPTVQRTGIDDLTPECRALQVEVQAAVGNEDPAIYRNHGSYVSTVAHLVGPHVDAGDITEECASCIISQFARRIPVEDQSPCGPDAPDPECAGQTCSTFTVCNEGGSCGSSGVCASTSDGGGLCVNGATPCAGLIPCPGGTGDCPAGSICAVNTCCGINVCVPASAFCSNPAPGKTVVLQPVAPTSGPTLSLAAPRPVKAWSTVKQVYR